LLRDLLVVADRLDGAPAAREQVPDAIEDEQVPGRIVGDAPALVDRLPSLGLLEEALRVCEGFLAVEGHRHLPLAELLDAGLLSGALAQEVQLGPAHLAETDDLDPLDDRGVDREDPLHADAAGGLPDRERGPRSPSAAAADDVALEDLDAGLVPLHHPDVDFHPVAGAEGGDLLLEAFGLDRANDTHDRPLWRPRVAGE